MPTNGNIGYFEAWTIGAFGSLLGGMVTAYYLGNKETREKIVYATPFLIVGVIGVFKAYSYVREDQLKIMKQIKC